MNGEVTASMEELKEVSPPNIPGSKSEQKVTPDICDDTKSNCQNSISTEITKHEDHEMNNSSPDNGLSKSPNSESNGLENHHHQENIYDSAQMSVQENSNSSSVQNNCSNSNESYMNMLMESIANSHEKSEQELDHHNTAKKSDMKDNNSVAKNGQSDAYQESIEDVHSEDDSGEEGSIISREHKAEDTVSINSDSGSEGDETSRESQRDNDIIVLDGENRRSSHSSDVHEIESDKEDCIVTSDDKSNSNHAEEKTQLRRSNRTRKRKIYSETVENGDESDIEEVELEDPLKRKSKPIVINDTKALVAMAAKQMKAGNSQKKEPTVVIIDTNSLSNKNMATPIKISNTNSASLNAQNLYQSIAARGTTVTPVSSKNASSTQVTQSAQTNILPSLTDDMFVVEAPSFIVPYVYEKPSVKPFREFVDKLGRELEEERLKKEKDEKERREKEKQEKRERGETVDSDEENKTEKKEDGPEEESKKKKSKRERRKPRNDEDDASWDGESLSESDDEILSDEDDKIVVKDKAEPLDQLKNVADLTAEKICSNKTSVISSMDCSLGKFFINIGLNLVQEYVQNDLLKQQNRKLYKEKKAGHSTKATEASIAQLMKNLEFSKENNAPYTFPQNKCEFCSFRSESKLVLAQHLETPHMKNNVYKCNYCTFEIRNPQDILYHMEAEHNIAGKLERAPSYHQCSNCPFEDNGKGKLARHLIACAKKFKPDINLAPPVDWEPPAKIPKIAKPRNLVGTYQNTFNRGQMGTNIKTPINVASIMQGVAGYRPRGRSPMSVPPRAAPVHGTPIVRGGVMVRHNAPSPVLLPNYPVVNNTKPKSHHQPSISITPLPRQPQPVQQTQPTQGNSKSTFVICEICDGYIKDLEQLRNHMQWIHKVKIHPKMIYNRPPLNCQKCQFRFFTDQGLERHLLGTHGLVTSSMQEAANKGKDAGRCPVCGRVYQWKLLNHVARDHNLTLKPAHLSYKCTVCTATFGMYKQFENHVYSAHSVVAKRVMDKTKTSTPPAKSNETLLKPLKINDEITIIPQPATKTITNKEK